MKEKKKGVIHRKQKGNSLETQTSKYIQELYNLNDDECCRNPHSGAATKELGDIFILKRYRDTMLPYAIECKNVEGWDIRNIWPSPSKMFTDWFSKIENEAGEKYCPFLIFSKAYFPIYALTKSEHLKKFNKDLSTLTYLKCDNDYIIFLMTELFKELK